MKDKEQEEWQRVLANPDNVIVSDWLLEQLDPADIAPEISNPRVIEVNCEVTFEKQGVSGSLVSFASDATEVVCVISLPVDKLVLSLFDDRLQKIRIITSASDEAWALEMLPGDEDAAITWSREGDYEALLTVVIKK
tara:strand:+ start:2312 stop:2722 length:411 start_codon:yes stop_codon:yes gene_type:complete